MNKPAALIVVALCTVGATAQPTDASPQSGLPGPDFHCKRVQPRLSRAALEVLGNPSYQTVPVRAEVKFLPPGVVGEVVILKSSGYRELDGAVFDALSKISCTFGVPLTEPLRAQQTFEFRSE